jgi:sodium-dependent dicarboxylate transporter 2/3/5
MNILLNDRILKILFSSILFTILINLPENEIFNAKVIRTIAVSVFIFSLWISEALPIPVTSLLPLVMMPLFDIADISQISKNYGNKVIFLMLSGFILATAIAKWGLNKRIALNILKITNKSHSHLILGFMIATASLSMWISNTATAAMLLPIALSVIATLNQKEKNFNQFAKILVLAIAYSASIGGMATIIGTPTNALFVSYIHDQFSYDFSFISWMIMFLPLSVILILLMWLYLAFCQKNIKINISKGSEFIDSELKKLGKITYEEKNIIIIFALIAIGWIVRSYLPINISDTSIGIAGIMFLFILPTKNSKNPILEWKDASKISWGTLLLFGGGISIAKSLDQSGIISIIGDCISTWSGNNILLAVAISLAVTIFLTEFLGNSALISVMIPILFAVAVGLGLGDSLEKQFMIVLPSIIAGSCAFMLPMATPPNAIIFSSNFIKISEMVKIGFFANVFSAITILLYFQLLTYFI